MLPHVFNPGAQEAEAEYFEFEASLVNVVSSMQINLQSEILSQKEKSIAFIVSIFFFMYMWFLKNKNK